MCLLRQEPRIAFTVMSAGIPIEVRALYPQTKTFCRDYLTEEPAAVTVSVCKEDIRKERKLSVRQAKNEGRFPIWYTARYLETLALCRRITAELIKYDVLLFHGAVMAAGGKAYLFTAPSGTGKTTHCRLWLKNIPDCHILNGDKPLLKFCGNGIFACGSPWMGKEHYGVNEMLPLEAVCILERDETNHVGEIPLADSFDTILGQCHIPEADGSLMWAVKLVRQLSGIKLYRLGCNMEDEAAFAAYNAVVREKCQQDFDL